MKFCAKCHQLKPLTDFHKNKGMPDGLHPYCKICKSTAAKRSYKRHRQFVRMTQRGYMIYSRYGIEPEEYDAIKAKYKSCPICGSVSSNVHLDHDHETGNIREFICSNCNLALGLLNDDPERMRRMIAYVRKHKRKGLIR